MKKTKFSKEEIRHLYRTFKQVNSLIRLTFFLHFSISIGQSIRSSKQRTFCFHIRGIISNGRYVYIYIFSFSNKINGINLECYRYSIFLFRNIDRANTGTIRFEDLVTTLSVLVHGSIEDRLNWVFDLYDLNKDGKMTRMVGEKSRINKSFFLLRILILGITSINSSSFSINDSYFET
jgi:hypothetical protein